MKSYFQIFLIYILLQICSCQICKFVEHNFYLIALKKNQTNSVGLNKYDYNLILETNPNNGN